jgi:beta-N-acetylhexosaminidase
MRLLQGLVHWIVLSGFLLALLLPGQRAWGMISPQDIQGQGFAQQQTPTPVPLNQAEEKAQLLLQNMTAEERVGQLFLVTFNGAEALPGSDIYDLINNYYVGGVVLLAANDNFSDDDKTVENAIGLTRQLQTIRRDLSRASRTNATSGESFIPAYVPLFVGISQEGDNYPYDQILNGVTPLPNEMALGATWNPEFSKQVGTVLGQEMSAIGINLILGPSLDVLETPHTETASDLGTRTFGGDPYWVGKLGQAYIEGVHNGSNGRVAVIAKHFPGHGGSDRLPEEEVATVRKSLDQLLGFELAPFINVTGQAPSLAATADGLLTAHIRYQGFQGNIRATTRPVSFDPQALKLLLTLPEFDGWRKNGGLMVSDNLGGRAVRGFYDLTSQTFDMPRRVALNAFLAGNDLLYVGDFSSGDLDSITSAKRTLEFFAQKYREDPAFAQRVDESVLRILALKYRLYDNFILDKVIVPTNPNPPIGQAGQVTFDVARKAATLISPTQAELDDTIPEPPNQNDRVVFITDVRLSQQCSQCAKEPIVAKRALEQAVLRLYGPQAGGQVTPANLISYSLEDLQLMLDDPAGIYPIERSLSRADWIVFVMLESSLRVPSYQTLSRFLSERPDLFQRKKQIVFALNAPYFLDATNISKLTAYYGLYSKVPQFVDIAAYLLFQELGTEGASPVSIPGISYDLSIALFPDAAQVIPLELDLPPAEPAQTTSTPEPAVTPVFRIGDIIPIRTGAIVDQNGHPVPDGTPVEFLFTAAGQTSPTRQVQTTVNGVARTSYTVSAQGALEIQAVSEPAKSDIFTIEVPIPSGEEISTPTETPTSTSVPTPTRTPNPIVAEIVPVKEPPKPALGDWIMALLLAAGVGWLAYKYMSNVSSMRWGVRTGLLVLIGGLIAYCYLALQLPGSEILLQQSIPRGVLLATISGAILGLVIAWSWRVVQKSSGIK